MLSDTGTALRDAIRDHPADDAPRLIYADYLDEHGDPERAQFIRLQCEEASLSPWDERRNELKRAWRRLLRENAKRWREGFPKWARGEYERGFLKNLHLSGAQFRRGIDDIWRLEPVSEIALYGTSKDFSAAVQDPLMAHIRSLCVWGLTGTEGDALHALAESPHALELQKLELGLSPTDAYSAASLRALQQWRLPHLRILQCHYAPPASNRNAEEVQLAIISGKLLVTVEELMLLGNRTDAVAEAFANAPTRHVRELWLANHNDDVWLEILTHTKRLKALRSLTFGGWDASAKLWQDFCHSALLGRLRELSCHNGQMSNWSVGELLAGGKLRHLEELQLHGSERLTDGGVKHFADATKALAHLRYLNVVWTGLTIEGVQRLRTLLPACHVAY